MGRGGLSGPGLTPAPIDVPARPAAGPGPAGRGAELVVRDARDRVGGEVVGEREAEAVSAMQREIARTPSIALAGPAFILLLFAMGSSRGIGQVTGTPVMRIVFAALFCGAAGVCFGVLAAKAATSVGRVGWTLGLLGSAVLLMQAVVQNV